MTCVMRLMRSLAEKGLMTSPVTAGVSHDVYPGRHGLRGNTGTSY